MNCSSLNIYCAYILKRILICLLCLPLSLFAQKKKTVAKSVTQQEPVIMVSFEVLENGDTINKLDSKGIQHGRWVIDHDAHFEEQGSIEVGSFDYGVRTGTWKMYTLQGVLQSEENYRKGLLDGEAIYYEEGKTICIGHYLALNAKQLYDTVMVEDPITNEFKPVKIKTDVGSIRHGTWTFFDPYTKQITRLVEYQAHEIVNDRKMNTLSKADSAYILMKMKAFPHVNKKSDGANSWMGETKSKRIKYTDLPDNPTMVKPNVRKK